MSNESSFLRSPCPQHGLVENVEIPPSTSNYDNVPLNARQLDENYVGAYHDSNYTDYGHLTQYHDNLHSDNLWYEGPPPPTANLEGQYTYQTNPNIGYPSSGNARRMLVPLGPFRGEYDIPPAHDLPNDGVGDRPQPMPDVADAFSRSVPESVPSRMSAMEGLKRLSGRYLHDSGSQVGALRMGLSPSGDRLRVTIVLDIDI
ncbi:hypothetical protein BJY52DRAFT_616991 [Lactarius psammicola]|nr:hypothetical protein BJY52DRAFT_616991 [Lactarius psammicola]